MNDSGDFRNNEIVKKIVQAAKKVAKALFRIVITIIMPIIIVFVVLAAAVYYIYVWVDGSENDDDWSNPEYAAGQYTSNVSINDDGTVSSNTTAQELWDKMEKANNRVSEYLSSPEELLKLMNAEMVTQYLDMRKNPDEPIDWSKANNTNDEKVQGIVKLIRADSDGNKSTMVYTDEETFQSYIDEYNSTGSETAKKNALSHFTLEKSSISSSQGTNAAPITAGTTINVPSGLGSMKTFEAWDYPKGNTSLHWSENTLQRKLWEKADGLNSYDENGLGVVNGRYVIACTETFGQPGDYIDFYLENGEVIPCIIGDIKSQSDDGANKWGHDGGQCIIEFMVKTDKWYNQSVGDPTVLYHKSWHGQNVVKAVNGGSYFDNPNFGTENVKANETTKNNDKEDEKDTKKDSNTENMKWPTEGTELSSKFGDTDGRNAGHKGIDIRVPQGTKVYACESGKVETAGWSDSAGNWVVINHGNGYVSKYMHNSELKVSAGDKVEKGQLIALSGNTGQSTGPHVHFQLEYKGTAIDPLTLKYDNGQGDGNGGIGSDVNATDSSSNSQYCAKVATWSHTHNKITSDDPEVAGDEKDTYDMKSIPVNYTEQVKGFTMPFDYLWALLVMSENKDFVFKLADLVYNSEIEITINDNLTTNTTTQVETYTKKERTDTEGKVTVTRSTKADAVMTPSMINQNNGGISLPNTISKEDNWSDEDPKSYKVTTETVEEKNTVVYNLTKANVWIENYTQEYTYKKPESSTTDNTVNFDDQNYGSAPDSTSVEDTYGHVQDLLNSTKFSMQQQNNDPMNVIIDGKIDYISTKIYHAVVNRSIKTTNTIETQKYIKTPAKRQEKIDPESTEPNFVTLYLENTNERGRANINSASSWLYEILENNDSTKDRFVDLTKYLLDKAKNGKNGKVKFDFSVFDPAEFTEVNGNNSNNTGTGKSGNFVRYYQTGESWSSKYYNSGGTIGSDGCGACALAMAVTGLTGQNVTPDIIVDYLNSIKKNTVYNGAESAQSVAKKYGLTYEQIDRNDNAKIDKALSQGKVCIFSIKGNGIYRGDGHFIMCYKKDNSGYYVLESARYYNENTPYKYNQVFSPGNQGVFVLGK